jgi:hypothetical protein
MKGDERSSPFFNGVIRVTWNRGNAQRNGYNNAGVQRSWAMGIKMYP